MAHFKTDNGENGAAFLKRMLREAQPTAGDLLYAGGRQASRILDRTARGVDFEGRPFAPYSTKGPYYHYPSTTAKNRRAATSRFLKIIGGVHRQTRLGIKFDSYGAMKRSLGRPGVDLRGVHAPHMLQAIVVRSGAISVKPDHAFGVALRRHNQAESELRIGIYGDEADRAEGHNEGAGSLPERRFFDASDRDVDQMMNDVADRMMLRIATRP